MKLNPSCFCAFILDHIHVIKNISIKTACNAERLQYFLFDLLVNQYIMYSIRQAFIAYEMLSNKTMTCCCNNSKVIIMVRLCILS